MKKTIIKAKNNAPGFNLSVTLWYQRRPHTARKTAIAVMLILLSTATLTTQPTALAADSTPTPVPQPTAAQMAAAGLDELPVAPKNKRVDLVAPAFPRVPRVTNPLFPISNLQSVVLNGVVDGKPFRTETTLMQETQILEWIPGQRVKVLVSQYTAYLDGRIQEVAIDLYAQGDDGSVWYFGEDVSDYARGVIFTNEGTWRAGKDGPIAMIMPAHPKVGNVHRAENIPGLVFEEVTIDRTGVQVDGPRGLVQGAIVGRELHSDGSFSKKIFAPGYGEFYSESNGDIEALALAVPIDALPGPAPAELDTLTEGADDIFDAAMASNWTTIATQLKRASGAWTAHLSKGAVPVRLKEPTERALRRLKDAVGSRNRLMVLQRSLDLRLSALDLQLQFHPATDIDLTRFDLWLCQVLVDAEARNGGGLSGDVFTLGWIRDRFVHVLDKVDVTRIDTLLGELGSQVVDKQFKEAAAIATELREKIEQICDCGI